MRWSLGAVKRFNVVLNSTVTYQTTVFLSTHRYGVSNAQKMILMYLIRSTPHNFKTIKHARMSLGMHGKADFAMNHENRISLPTAV